MSIVTVLTVRLVGSVFLREGGGEAMVAEGRRRRIVTCEYCYRSDCQACGTHYFQLEMSIFSKKLKPNTLGVS